MKNRNGQSRMAKEMPSIIKAGFGAFLRAAQRLRSPASHSGSRHPAIQNLNFCQQMIFARRNCGRMLPQVKIEKHLRCRELLPAQSI
jgi:hypothetical protein